MNVQQTLGCIVSNRLSLRRTLCAAILLATGAAASAQSFGPGNIVVVRVGDGSAVLGNTATPTFLEELTPSGTLVRTLALPTAVSGTNRRLTNSGSATSEGALSLSPDGLYFGLAGYDAALATASVATSASATINRIAARVNLATGLIDTTTALADAQTANNIRSAVWTSGGTAVYTAGGSGSARFAAYGGTTSTQLSTTATNLRVLNIFNGQLYASSGSGAFLGVNTVGSGLPTTSGQTIALLSGFTTVTGQNCYDYFLASPTVLYVADERTTSGIQKWTFSNGAWALAYTAAGGFRGLTGVVTGNNVQLYATSITGTLVSFTDLLSPPPSPPTPAFSAGITLRTAATNTALRGVRLVPGVACTAAAISGQPAAASVCASGTATFTTTATGTGPLSYQWRNNGSSIIDGPGISGATTASVTLTGAGLLAGNYDVVVTNSCGTATSSAAALSVLSGTAIGTQPASATVCEGSPATFSVVATGGGTLSYQWYKDAGVIEGATGPSYTIAAASAASAGAYQVIVTGSCGPVTSEVASLAVGAGTSITASPASQGTCAGGTVNFTAAAVGSGTLSYQWFKNGTGPIDGATTATLTISNASPADVADYSVAVSGSCGTATSTAASLSLLAPTAIANSPAPATVCSGGPAVFAVSATGTGVLSYQWRKDGQPLTGATSATFTVPTALAGDTGLYDVVVSGLCGTVVSAPAQLNVDATTAITGQPVAQTVCSDTAATFSVAATGTGTLSYQWRKDAVAIAGATAATYSIASATAANDGSYDVVITGTCGSATSAAATLTVTPVTAIIGQPVAQTVCTDTSATFSVAATGTGTLSYQWRKDAVAIAGAIAATYSIASATAANDGSYDVVVTGTCGSATSSAATLTVTPVTAITGQPVAQTVCTDTSATFSVAATGTGTLSYQWRKDAVAIAGATAATYSIASATSANDGSYDVVVTGTCGSITSSVATLSATPVTAITGQPVAQTVCSDTGATFSVAATGTGTLSYQWRKDAVAIAGATAATYSIASATAANDGSYDVVVTGTCGSATSSAATLMVTPITAITGQPAAQTACTGGTAIFSVIASGTGTLSYQWSKDGAALTGATGPSLTVANAAASDAGSYAVSVTGGCGLAVLSSSATLTIDAATVIATQPVASTVCENAPATLTVAATGTGTLSYQWRRDGQAVVGATSATLAIAAVTAAETGSYDVIVTGSCGQATSSAVAVSIGAAIGISAQPANVTASPTSTVTLSVTATGFGPLSYQWFRDGVAIANGAAGASIGGGTVAGASGTLPASGSDTATLSISDLAASDAGSYTVVLTNPCGTVTSSAATITVSAACSLADVAGGGSTGLVPDGVVDGNDFIAFINSFGVGDISVDPLADVAGGGVDALLPDGIIDGNDFIAFINAFAAGC